MNQKHIKNKEKPHFDVYFGRKSEVSWVKPGYHSQFRKWKGEMVTTGEGIKAKIVDLSFQVEWKDLSRKEKNEVKRYYGAHAKRQYHRFTRVVLRRPIYIQDKFPFIEWD